MFTQCPDCGTVFRITARALRAAQGSVRCGICSATFNALDALSEHPVPNHGDEPAHDDTITVEELPGNEFIELSGVFEGPSDDADDDVAGGDEPAAGAPGEAEHVAGATGTRETGAPGDAAVSADDGEAVPDSALEFHGSIDDLERLFVSIESPSLPPLSGGADGATESRIAAFRASVDRIAAADLSGIEVEEQDLPDMVETDDADPAEVAAILAFRRQGDDPGGDTSDASPDDRDADEPDEGALGDLDRTDEFPILVLDEKDEEPLAFGVDAGDIAGDAAAVPESPGGILIPAELRRDTAAAADAFSSSFEPGEEPVPRRWPWAVALLLLLLVLGAQAVHFWRSDLVRNPLAGPWLMRAYGMLGLPLAAPTDLAAFELRQLGTASDTTQAGRLKLRASIVNLAAFAQPYPLLRLTLQDRFGSTIGVRDLEPAEYLPGGTAPASNLMAAGQRADAEVVFVDPGRDAVGYELDVCVRLDGGVRCSTDPGSP